LAEFLVLILAVTAAWPIIASDNLACTGQHGQLNHPYFICVKSIVHDWRVSSAFSLETNKSRFQLSCQGLHVMITMGGAAPAALNCKLH
jgi:hypothetical protein